MAPSRAAKGKKRARDEDVMETGDSGRDSPVASTSQLETPPAKVSKPKRAVTKKCPVCDEDIPVRLLAAHAELEDARVQEILHRVGSTEVLEEAEPDDGFTARTRRSALKARKILSNGSSKHKSTSASDPATSEAVEYTLRILKRHRKQRHSKLREMTRDDEEVEGLAGRHLAEGTVCPVCLKIVQGDVDVVEAHVDSCLAHEARLQDERERDQRESESRRDVWEEIEVDDGMRIQVTDGVSFQGTGFDIRNRDQQDIDDDVDVDGEDDIMYGAVQFTEGDILAAESAHPATRSSDGDSGVQVDEDVEVDVGVETSGLEGLPEMSLRDLVAEGKVVKRRDATYAQGIKKTMDEVMGVGEAEEVDKSVELARTADNLSALISALEDKVKLLESTRISSSTSLLCRICIDPYTEPTVSTGCWHTCCRECWLRCLGSTKLCPICKRITTATELRRIYL